jgi:hypothetical protein
MWNLVSVYLQIVLILMRLVHGLRRTYHRLGNHFGRIRWKSFWTHRMELLGDAQVEGSFGPFEDSVSAGAR